MVIQQLIETEKRASAAMKVPLISEGVQPTSGTAKPTLTTVALAIRTADYIVQQLK